MEIASSERFALVNTYLLEYFFFRILTSIRYDHYWPPATTFVGMIACTLYIYAQYTVRQIPQMDLCHTFN
jgi:hypothetical protein